MPPFVNEGTKVHNPRRLLLCHVVTYTYIHSNMHIIYADKSVSVRGSIRKFGKDKSYESYLGQCLT